MNMECFEDFLSRSFARRNYAVGLFLAATIARFVEVKSFWALEFGVAGGGGLRALRDHARVVSDLFDLEIKLAGFDSGRSLPPPRDARDHPETWSDGDFAMEDPSALRSEFGAQLIIGDIADTAPQFLASRVTDSPIGFIAIDVDLYSSTVDCLSAIAEVPPTRLLPITPFYFDDIFGVPQRVVALFRCPKAGQLLAIDEFNEQHDTLCLAPIHAMHHRLKSNDFTGAKKMFALHVLEHPFRSEYNQDQAYSMTQSGGKRGVLW